MGAGAHVPSGRPKRLDAKVYLERLLFLLVLEQVRHTQLFFLKLTHYRGATPFFS